MFLVPISSPLIINEFTDDDSFSFTEEAANFDSNCIVTSLETEILFTNIPLDEAVETTFFLIMIPLTILSIKVVESFSNLLPMIHFSHLLINIVANETVLSCDHC